jgi:hypothetical protein
MLGAVAEASLAAPATLSVRREGEEVGAAQANWLLHRLSLSEVA